jgi:hypothetical protein
MVQQQMGFDFFALPRILIYSRKGGYRSGTNWKNSKCRTATVDWEVEESGTRGRAHSKNRGVVKYQGIIRVWFKERDHHFWFEHYMRTRGIRKATMIGENFGTKYFIPKLGSMC